MINYYELSDNECGVINAVVDGVLARHNMSVCDVDIDITVLSREDMRELNAESRGIDKATDVLSYPAIDIVLPFMRANYPHDINPETNAVYLGEIMICREIMTEQAAEYGHSERRELAYLVDHGMHHLLGYDHMNDKDKAAMRESEEAVLTDLDITRY